MHSREGLFGDKHDCGKVVSVPSTDCISPLDVEHIQDIDVDMKGVER